MQRNLDIINSPDKIEHFDMCYRIGNEWLFNSYTGTGYKVIRNTEDEVVGFQEAYHLNGSSYTSNGSIPAGVLRKSSKIMKLNHKN